ncbi:hypothetical protein [Granulicella arctica]|uniref:hypothetical protein n=1 Tax=Granulicella arctica TaxID=940613 RepID=UPI0021DFD94D|nr:hypothetical protein [Granulicella arctica]
MIRNARDASWSWIKFSLATVAIYFALQALIILAHEHAHSTTAWLLGFSRTPFTVIQGNFVTMRGWDEGVPYDQLFPASGNPAEAAIGAMPLLMHVTFVVVSLSLLELPKAGKRKALFYILYWFVVINLAELVAYLLMRPFAGSGDTGRFNQGLAISPWFLFVGGILFLLIACWVLLFRVMPRLDRVVGFSQRLHKTVVWMTAFFMFLWGSGIRILSLYPDRQWKFGLIGLAGFAGWVLVDRLRSSPKPASL